jgi:lauroyl/myristoyl acyltransferase
MDLQRFTTGKLAIKMVFAITKTPPRFGYWFGNLVADWFSGRKNSTITRVVRANQWVIRGEQSPPEELDRATKLVFRHAARCYYDLYHNLNNPEALERLAPPSPKEEWIIQRSQEGGEGMMVVGPHLSGFDLVLLALAHRGLRGQGLSPTQPPGGYEIQNHYRASTGIELTPINRRSLHQAINYMKNGGLAFTGVDRPVDEDKTRLRFFGRESQLPTGPVRLAMKAQVPIMIVAAQYRSDGLYHLITSDPIPMDTHRDRTTAILRNAEKVLSTLEGFIRQAPEQWLMFFPVWPQAVEEVP